MVAACVIRRKQLMQKGYRDPYAAKEIGLTPLGSGISTVSHNAFS